MKNACSDCLHLRLGKPANPLAGVRLVSQKVLELRARWEQELATRATFEEQRMLAGVPFDFEPIAFPHCAHFSKEEATDRVSGRTQRLYVLCAQANPEGTCAEFSRKAD